MNTEGQLLGQKSLCYALGQHKDADGLACDYVGFANAVGGTILLGMEEGQDEPPATQRVADDFADRLRKRLAQITVNVGVAVRKAVAGNGGEFVEIQVFRNEQSIAATSDRRYFIRVSEFVRGKADAELLEHYLFVRTGLLTNLGILWIGRQGTRRHTVYLWTKKA